MVPEVHPDLTVAPTFVDASPGIASANLVAPAVDTAPFPPVTAVADGSDPLVFIPVPSPPSDLPSMVIADWSPSEAVEWFSDFLTSVA